MYTGKVGRNFVGETEWKKRMTACAFALCTIRLVKLTPGVNFINMFMRRFYARRSQKGKKLLELTVFFARVKAACKMLVKLSSAFHSVVVNEVDQLCLIFPLLYQTD